MKHRRLLYLAALYFLFSALVLLCTQARMSKVIPQEGPLQHLSSATKMIHDRLIWSDQLEQRQEDEIELDLYKPEFADPVSSILPTLPMLTVLQRNPLRISFYLRPPPYRT